MACCRNTWLGCLTLLLGLLSNQARAADQRVAATSHSHAAKYLAAIAAAESVDSSNSRQIHAQRERRAIQFISHLSTGLRQQEQTAWQDPAQCQQDPLTTRHKLCGLRWRKNDAFSTAKATVDDMGHKTKSKFVGSKIADHLEVDGNGVRFQFAW